MVKVLLVLGVVWSLAGISLAQTSNKPEPRIPLGASWGMTMQQAQQLPELERVADGALQQSYLIRGTSQNELVARWKDRAISFHIDNEVGLYAINIEMTPQSVQHTQNAADQELLDLEQCAPVRLAIMRKYGASAGLAVSWDTSEIAPLSPARVAPPLDIKTESLKWSYARNWLIWEGQESRLALGEQSVWYASRVGLAKRERRKRELEKERDQSLERESALRAKRQQQLEDAREAVTFRAQTFEALF
jgi:hypothetical protein